MDGSGRVAIIGAGPAGLFLARLLRIALPRTAVDVYERNDPDDATGFGVTISDRTMAGVATADPATHRRIAAASTTLSGVELRVPGGRMRFDGFPVAAIARKALLVILREHAERAGARLHYRHAARADDLDAAVVACADGAGSAERGARAAQFGTRMRRGAARFAWLGTDAPLGDTATMTFVQTRFGPMAAHAYPSGAGPGTVVVETDEATWRAAGLDADRGELGGGALDLLSGVFAELLDGHRLVGHRSRWDRFPVVTNERWSHDRLVLLGDAAHTAHFTVGSGTKLALEDAVSLAAALHRHGAERAAAFAAYERERRPAAARTQRMAEPSMHWWETYGRRLHLPPAQFGMHFITRTGALSYLGLRKRCPDRVDDAERAYHDAAGSGPGRARLHAVAAPMRLGGRTLPNRLATVLPAVARGPGTPPAGLLLCTRASGRADEDLLDAWEAVRGRLLSAREAGAAPPGGLWVALLPCPDAPEWTVVGDEVVRDADRLRARGAAAVLLRGAVEASWERVLRYASRVRTEADVPVAVEVPADWALHLPERVGADAWPARIHLALVSGRIDFVVARPDPE